MTNKTISINPALFSISGASKTRKRDKTKKPNAIPIISPNVLKNKLLKRIKEHKKKETSNLDKKPSIEISTTINSNKTNKLEKNKLETNNFNDEFNDSINYLQALSKQKKINEDKIHLEKQKQKRREDIEKMTVKNYHSLNQTSTMPLVNLDLPEELQQPLINITTENFKPSLTQEPIILSMVQKDNVPYGILKGGIKPTYRSWSQTQKNMGINDAKSNKNFVIEGGEINKANIERENRLQNLKEKINSHKLTSNNSNNSDAKFTPLSLHIEPTHNINNINNINNHTDSEPKKQIIKKTIKRKYTLGKSKLKKSVAVLLKDRGTRKKIISAQKELKQKSINDIKTYLRDHNMIKIGSNAPNDVIRKLYESCMLAGEVTNSNTDILLHNLIKDSKEI